MNIKTPAETAAAALAAGTAKATLTRTNLLRLLGLSVLAGCYLSIGGTLAVLAGNGLGAWADGNPILCRLVSGCVFPIGLILIVVLGAELFTGNNALLVMPWCHRRCSIGTVAINWAVVWLGNFAGTAAFAWLMVHLTGLTTPEPWHSAVAAMAEAKCSLGWWTVLLRGIGANWCVCLAIWLALSGHNLLEKMAGCWLPVMAFVVMGYEHCVANMFFIPLGMMEGAQVTVAQMITANLIPATIGNMIGGALLVGCLHARLYPCRCDNLPKNDGDTAENTPG